MSRRLLSLAAGYVPRELTVGDFKKFKIFGCPLEIYKDRVKNDPEQSTQYYKEKLVVWSKEAEKINDNAQGNDNEGLKDLKYLTPLKIGPVSQIAIAFLCELVMIPLKGTRWEQQINNMPIKEVWEKMKKIGFDFKPCEIGSHLDEAEGLLDKELASKPFIYMPDELKKGMVKEDIEIQTDKVTKKMGLAMIEDDKPFIAVNLPANAKHARLLEPGEGLKGLTCTMGIYFNGELVIKIREENMAEHDERLKNLKGNVDCGCCADHGRCQKEGICDKNYDFQHTSITIYSERAKKAINRAYKREVEGADKGKGGKNKRVMYKKRDGQEIEDRRNIKVTCIDGTQRLCCIRRGLKHIVKVKTGDTILVQFANSKYNRDNIICTYTPDEISKLKEIGHLNETGKGGKNENKKSEKVFTELKGDGQEYAQVAKMLDNGRLEATCFDGIKRLCHFGGKLRKKAWINTGDIILVELRDYQDNEADVILKYTADEARNLKAYGELPESAEINETDVGLHSANDVEDVNLDNVGSGVDKIDDL